jgi:hypothetical protein
MAYKLQITDQKNGISFNARYDNMARAERPEIIAKNKNGDIIKLTTVYQGTPLLKGATQKKWLDDKGKEYSKSELIFYLGDQEVNEIAQTKVLNIEGFQPISNYTDNYVISAYYEVYPDDNGMKKDIDKQRAIGANLSQMHKLWEYLDKTQQVARGEFCPASKGFIASDGYIRPIKFGNKWGIEIGVFKEEKVFEHLQEGAPKDVVMVEPKANKRIKLV